MKEDKKVFLKVDSVEPVYNVSPFSYSGVPYLKGIKVWIGSEGHLFPCDRFTVCEPDEAREAGREEMRKALFDIFKDMGQQSRKNIFGSCYFEAVVRDHTPEEIITGWEKWKKEKDEIHVKDEVQHKPNGEKAVVLNVLDGFIYAVTKKKAFITCAPVGDYKKTGVHVDDLDAYLGV